MYLQYMVFNIHIGENLFHEILYLQSKGSVGWAKFWLAELYGTWNLRQTQGFIDPPPSITSALNTH